MPTRCSALEHLLLDEPDALASGDAPRRPPRPRRARARARSRRAPAAARSRPGASRRASPSGRAGRVCLRTFSSSAALRSARSCQSVSAGSASASASSPTRPHPARLRAPVGASARLAEAAGACASTASLLARSIFGPSGSRLLALVHDLGVDDVLLGVGAAPSAERRSRRRPPACWARSYIASDDLVERGLQRLGLGVDLRRVLGRQRLADRL